MNFVQFFAGIAFVGVALVVFFLYARSLFQGNHSFVQRFVPFEPRRPVPWTGWDLLLFFAFWFLITVISGSVCRGLQLSSHIQAKEFSPQQMLELRKEHGITQLIVCGQDDPRVFLLVFLTGVIIIPIGEEFLFRLLLQGSLEKLEGSSLRFLRLRGLFAVFCSSTIFAALHLRDMTATLSFQKIFDGIAAMSVGYLVVIALIGMYLLFIRGATLRDLGIDRRKIFGDCLLGIGAACLLIPPIYLLNNGLAMLVGDLDFALDPIPLFFFAAGIGVLYYRTHRILPGIVLHMIFNGIAVALVYRHAHTFGMD
jgi:membrane protease YdiL (CAAX protease family)